MGIYIYVPEAGQNNMISTVLLGSSPLNLLASINSLHFNKFSSSRVNLFQLFLSYFDLEGRMFLGWQRKKVCKK